MSHSRVPFRYSCTLGSLVEDPEPKVEDPELVEWMVSLPHPRARACEQPKGWEKF